MSDLIGIAKQRKVKAARKRQYVCVDGPFKSTLLFLTSAHTLIMNIGQIRGRYVKQHGHTAHLIWEEHK